MTNPNFHIEKCRQLISRSFNNIEVSSWNTEDFGILSKKIFEKTGIQLSVSTLKRIWGKVNYDSSPSLSTLNTLAKYLGYESWRDFQRRNPYPSAQDTLLQDIANGPGSRLSTDTQAPQKHSQTVAGPSPKTSKTRNRLLLPILGGIALILIAGGLLFGKKGKTDPPGKPSSSSGSPSATASATGSPSTGSPLPTETSSPASGKPFQFDARKTSENLPNSVIFDYDASSAGSDSVFIQQSWDPARQEKVPADGRQHTSIYYYPGYFDAKLVVNGDIKKHSPVFIKTRGWKGFIEKMPTPIYLTRQEGAEGGLIGISRRTLREKTGSPVFNGTWVAFMNVQDFEGVDPGNFLMETSLQNTSTVEESLCRKVIVNVVGKESGIIIPLTDKGCVADCKVFTGNRWISGADHDLSAFGCDFRQFQHLSCQVVNKRLKVSLNGKIILDTEQEKTIGGIIGLRFAFEGTGQVNEVSLGAPGKRVYHEKL